MYSKNDLSIFKRVLSVDKRLSAQAVNDSAAYIMSPFCGFRLRSAADGLPVDDRCLSTAGTVDNILAADHPAEYPLPTVDAVKQFIRENGLRRNGGGKKPMDIGGGHFFNPFYLLDVLTVLRGSAELFPFYAPSSWMKNETIIDGCSPLVIKTWDAVDAAYIFPVRMSK